MNDTAEPTSGRVTNQELDRRLGRVESILEQHGIRLHELGNEVGVVKLQVEHSQEMIRVRFTGLETKVDAYGAKLDALLERLSITQADPSATPAGRLLAADLRELDEWREKTVDPQLQSLRSIVGAVRVVMGGSVVTAMAAIAATLAALGVIP